MAEWVGEPLLPSFMPTFLPSSLLAKLHSGKTDKRGGERLSRSPSVARSSSLLSEITAEDWMAMAVVCNLRMGEGGRGTRGEETAALHSHTLSRREMGPPERIYHPRPILDFSYSFIHIPSHMRGGRAYQLASSLEFGSFALVAQGAEMSNFFFEDFLLCSALSAALAVARWGS